MAFESLSAIALIIDKIALILYYNEVMFLCAYLWDKAVSGCIIRRNWMRG